MSLLISEKLQEANKAIVSTFDTAIQSAKSNVDALLTVQPINAPEFTHPFTFGPGKARKWTGERQLKSAAIHEIAGRVTPFENSITVPMDAIQSGQISRYTLEAVNLGRESAKFYDDQIAQLLVDNTAINYDGKVLFATSRTYKGGTQANLFGSRALNATNLTAAEGDLNGMKNDKGEDLYVRGTHLIVSPGNAETARQLVMNQFDSAGASNPHFNRYTVVVLPGLDDGFWYLAGADNGVLPFMAYEFVPANLVAFTQPNDYSVFYKDEAVFGWTQKSATVAAPYQFIVANKVNAL